MWDHDHECPLCFSEMWLKKDFPGGAPWHPGVTGHELQAKGLVFYYLQAISNAVTNLRAKLADGSLAAYAAELGKPEELPPGFPPKPIVASSGLEGLYADLPNAKCATTYEPKHRGVADDLGDVLLNGSKGVSAWSHEISPGDAPELIAHHADERGYLDRKWVFLGRRADGPIELRMAGASGQGTFMVCEATWGWTRPADDGSVIRDVTYELDGAPVQPLQNAGPLQEKVPNCAFFNTPLSAGDHTLKVTVNDGKPSMYVALAYLIWW